VTDTFRARGWLAAVTLLVLGHAAPVLGYASARLGDAWAAPATAVDAAVSPVPEMLVQEAAGGTTLSPAELDDLAARVAGELRCPVCRNQAVVESSAQLSREMQALIRERLAAGDTPEQVKAYFVARYGEWILLKPEARGVNLLVYVVPILTFLLGGLLVWRLLRRWSGGAEARLASATAGGAPTSVDQHPAGAASADTARAVAEPATRLSDRDEAWLEKAVSER
jgi:cytochrome c-type biogenesis protein CcmH